MESAPQPRPGESEHAMFMRVLRPLTARLHGGQGLTSGEYSALMGVAALVLLVSVTWLSQLAFGAIEAGITSI